jgi:hypothetical protein
MLVSQVPACHCQDGQRYDHSPVHPKGAGNIRAGARNSPCQLNMLMLNMEEMNEPGKNSAVMNVKVIMAILSLFADPAIMVFS